MRYIIIFWMLTTMTFAGCVYEVRKVEAVNGEIVCKKSYILESCFIGSTFTLNKVKELIPNKCLNADWSEAVTYYDEKISYETAVDYKLTTP